MDWIKFNINNFKIQVRMILELESNDFGSVYSSTKWNLNFYKITWFCVCKFSGIYRYKVSESCQQRVTPALCSKALATSLPIQLPAHAAGEGYYGLRLWPLPLICEIWMQFCAPDLDLPQFRQYQSFGRKPPRGLYLYVSLCVAPLFK